jgi:hypothetical protein
LNISQFNSRGSGTREDGGKSIVVIVEVSSCLNYLKSRKATVRRIPKETGIKPLLVLPPFLLSPTAFEPSFPLSLPFAFGPI